MDQNAANLVLQTKLIKDILDILLSDDHTRNQAGGALESLVQLWNLRLRERAWLFDILETVDGHLEEYHEEETEPEMQWFEDLLREIVMKFIRDGELDSDNDELDRDFDTS